jgi:hypothetical protein
MVASRRRHKVPSSALSSIGEIPCDCRQHRRPRWPCSSLTTTAYAQNGNIDNATNTVNNNRQADPPAVSTGTVLTPQPPVHPNPNGGSDVQRMRTNPPPSPGH